MCQLFVQWDSAAPPWVNIVTGWGRHTKRQHHGEAPPLKAAVVKELERMKAPFVEQEGNPGLQEAPGIATREWVMRAHAEGLLRLSDSVNPRPAEEQAFVHYD